MIKTLGKVVLGIVGVGVGIFAAIAAAGFAGDGLEEAFGGSDKSGDTEALRRAS